MRAMKPLTRSLMKQRLIDAARTDERIVGLVDYGSSIYERDDEWSDIDVAFFIRDADFEAFNRAWKLWAAQFGDLLLAYISWVEHPWVVYAAQPVPLRVDFNFYRTSEIEHILVWPNSPHSVETMVWYDGSQGRLTQYVQQIVGKSLRPSDLPATFEQACGDFWYYILFTLSKWKRGQGWLARQTFHCLVMQNLFALLRIEADALDEWMGSSLAWAGVEHTLSPERLSQLEDCIPALGLASLQQSLIAAARLGYSVCEQIAQRYGWAWPRTLADQTLQVIVE